MRRKKFFIINCILLFSLVLLYKAFEYILRLNNLRFLNYINITVAAIFTILLFSILIQIIIFLYNITCKSDTKTPTRILCRLGIFFIVLGIGIYIFIGFIFYAFTEPEHIVEKDGKKMVASVESFLQVRVGYYDYINPFIRGNRIRIYEDYGNGGYDPFEQREVLIPKHYSYYDDNGNIIKSN
ncbi:MAG: hypothetical protein KIA08_14865 [Clostridium baratii]|uniref:hypothetical protein n=1 Tax=Clostridium baratii TaxID=1561 RepID=UPI00242A6F84|nr:hypothetical protein [Clostridium baratii]MBS6043951.1 hypothetical protein [Clostridium baratii]